MSSALHLLCPRCSGPQTLNAPKATVLRETFAFIFLKKNTANSVEPDQTQRFVASDMGLHCLQVYVLWVTRYQHNLVFHF